MYIIRDTFDFEIGHLAKSPCKGCTRRQNLPECAETCRVLDRVRTILAKGISCTGHHPFLEA